MTSDFLLLSFNYEELYIRKKAKKGKKKKKPENSMPTF